MTTKRRRRKRSRNFNVDLKVRDEDGNIIMRIDDNLKKSIKKFVKLCDEKFSIDWKKL